jgi:hypothetical protein
LDDDVEAPQFQSRIKKGEIDEKASYFSLITKKIFCASQIIRSRQESEKEL